VLELLPDLRFAGLIADRPPFHLKRSCLMFSPYWTHPLTALLRFGIVVILLLAFKVPAAPWIAFAYVAGHYEGREADDVEHRAKHETPPLGGFEAWAGAALWYGWALANVLQSLCGIVPILIAAIVISILGG
jgi:hypothetical protein